MSTPNKTGQAPQPSADADGWAYVNEQATKIFGILWNAALVLISVTTVAGVCPRLLTCMACGALMTRAWMAVLEWWKA